MTEQPQEQNEARLPEFAEAPDPLSLIRADPSKQRRWEANRKSVSKAYLLWLFLGPFGGHRFYLGYPASAIFMIMLTTLALLTTLVSFAGVILFAPPALWLLVDGFIIPAIVRHQNGRLIEQILR